MNCEQSLTFDQIVEITLIENQQHGSFRCSCCRRTRLIIDQCELAEVTAGRNRREFFLAMMTAPDDLNTACKNDKQRFPRFTLPQDDLARRVFLLEHFDQKLSELPLAETMKQRHLREEVESSKLLRIDNPSAPVPAGHVSGSNTSAPYHTGVLCAPGCYCAG